MNEGALATLDDDAAIAELASGTFLKQLAARYGVVKSAIYKRLSKHPEYQDAIRLQAEALVERATLEVFECDAATVNIARARVDAAHKWAAARDPARWAPGQRLMGADGGALQVEIVRYSAPVTIDATPVLHKK